MATRSPWTTRIPLAIDVMVNYPALGWLRCRTRNLSLRGVFIETGAITLAPGAAVEIVFSARGPDRRRCNYRVQAAVARVAQDGAGLVFSDTGSGTEHMLWDVLRTYAREESQALDPGLWEPRAATAGGSRRSTDY